MCEGWCYQDGVFAPETLEWVRLIKYWSFCCNNVEIKKLIVYNGRSNVIFSSDVLMWKKTLKPKYPVKEHFDESQTVSGCSILISRSLIFVVEVNIGQNFNTWYTPCILKLNNSSCWKSYDNLFSEWKSLQHSLLKGTFQWLMLMAWQKLLDIFCNLTWNFSK